MSDDAVLFSEKTLSGGQGIVAFIHLNAPKSFNSLTLEMVQLIQAKLDQWRGNDELCAIFLDGEGDKAFCAGGDVKSLYAGRQDTAEGILNPSAVQFFEQEYHLDYCLHTFDKPIVCWGQGVVMGGGLGLMAGCTHRIMTQSSRTAMPEITIGLFPDVGGSWFLNRAPGRTGLFLGLTGVKLNAHDAIFAGLANRFIDDALKQSLIEGMLDLSQQDYQEGALTTLLKDLQAKSIEHLPESQLQDNYALIEAVCDQEHLVDVAGAIMEHFANHDNAWLAGAASTLAAGCPVTAHLVFEQLKRSRHLSLREVFSMELHIAKACMQNEDFYEGVRALLIDKDKSPRWQHEHIAAVPAGYIQSYFP